MDYKALISTKFFLVLLVLFLVFLGNLRFQQWKAQQAIEKEKQALSQQADALQKKNNELNQSLSYLNTTDFKERIARQQLNLKKDGEVVYTFTDPQASTSTPTGSTGGSNNFQKWINYFVGND